MATLSVFKSTIPSVTYIFGDGTPAIFVNGVYRTDVQKRIDALQSEIDQGHPHIYIDPKEREIDSELVDPINALRAKIIAEYKAQEAAAVALSNDRGTSDQSGPMPANSLDVASAAAGGSGAQTISLAALKASAVAQPK